MRGKQAKAAEGRRGWADIERERAEANHRADRAASELEVERAKLGRQLAALREENEQLRLAAAQAIAPVVESQQVQIDTLREERDGLVQKLAAWSKARDKYERALGVTIANNFPIDTVSAQTLIHQVWWVLVSHEEPDALEYDEVAGRSRRTGSSAVRAVDRGRMTLDQGDTLAEVRTGRRRPSAQGDPSDYGNLWTTEADIVAACDLAPREHPA